MKAINKFISEKLKISDSVIKHKELPIDDVKPKDKPESSMETFYKLILDYQFYFDELSFDLKEIFGNNLPIFRDVLLISEIEAEIHIKNAVTFCLIDKSDNNVRQSTKTYRVDMINTLAKILGEGDEKLGNGIVDCIYKYISDKILNKK